MSSGILTVGIWGCGAETEGFVEDLLCENSRGGFWRVGSGEKV